MKYYLNFELSLKNVAFFRFQFKIEILFMLQLQHQVCMLHP